MDVIDVVVSILLLVSVDYDKFDVWVYI